MAAFHSFRSITFIYIVAHLLSLLCFVQLVHAAPALSLSTISSNPDGFLSSYLPVSSSTPKQLNDRLVRREKFVLQTNSTGGLEAFNADTRKRIPQALASDGAGRDFDASAILWIGYCAVIGLPMMFAGLRGGRFSTGVGMGVGTALVGTFGRMLLSLLHTLSSFTS